MKQIKLLIDLNKDISKSINNCHDKIDETNSIVKNLELKINECFQEVKKLGDKCKVLENANVQLKSELNKLQQYSLNCVDIFGVPESKNENVILNVLHIAKALNVQLSMQDIDCCHPLHRKQESSEPRGIILKFVARWKT